MFFFFLTERPTTLPLESRGVAIQSQPLVLSNLSPHRKVITYSITSGPPSSSITNLLPTTGYQRHGSRLRGNIHGTPDIYARETPIGQITSLSQPEPYIVPRGRNRGTGYRSVLPRMGHQQYGSRSVGNIQETRRTNPRLSSPGHSVRIGHPWPAIEPVGRNRAGGYTYNQANGVRIRSSSFQPEGRTRAGSYYLNQDVTNRNAPTIISSSSRARSVSRGPEYVGDPFAPEIRILSRIPGADTTRRIPLRRRLPNVHRDPFVLNPGRVLSRYGGYRTNGQRGFPGGAARVPTGRGPPVPAYIQNQVQHAWIYLSLFNFITKTCPCNIKKLF